MNLHILGIRHHGVGSSANLVRRLEEIAPDCILIEGPSELLDCLLRVDLGEFVPPVAILGYNPAQLTQSAFYPFASFSPVWQAMLYAKRHGVECVMADMPLKYQFGYEREDEEGEGSSHPIDEIARLEGYESGEVWWEHRFEQRFCSDAKGHFEAVELLMATLRGAYPKENRFDAIREAFMREAIRSAKRQKRENVVFVCGAWHTSALTHYAQFKGDKELIKNLPSQKVETTWIPWPNSRLAWESGYGAGIDSAGWYDHLHRYPQDDGTIWLYKATKIFRKRKIDISTAHAIETLRTAKALAGIRGVERAGLRELSDAILSVMCGGDAILLNLIHDELIVGRAIGKVPEGSANLPLQRDFEAKIKEYRLQKRDDEKLYTLDLRNEKHLEKSIFLHRLGLLELGWAKQIQSRTKGSFKEVWQLRWKPDYELDIIDKAIWGNSVESASQNLLKHHAKESQDSLHLAHLIELSLICSLFESVEFLIVRIDNLISQSHDIAQLAQTLLSLMEISRYDDIRKTDKGILKNLIEVLIIKVTVNLTNACYGLEYHNAKSLLGLIRKLNVTMGLEDHDEHYERWVAVLTQIANDTTMPHLIQGGLSTLLFNNKLLDGEKLQTLLSKALSQGTDSLDCAYWVEGLLDGSAMVLLVDENLWNILYYWVDGLDNEEFDAILPILRRSFGGYSQKIRQSLGEKAKLGIQTTVQQGGATTTAYFDTQRAEDSLQITKGWLYYDK